MLFIEIFCSAFLARPVETKKFLGGATNFDILLSTIVARRKKFSVSNRLQRLEELNISRKQVM